MENKNRKLNRLKGFDYKSSSLYFITICVQNRICSFGEIVNGEMVYNDIGQIILHQWDWLLKRYDYLLSHAFVLMPNHVHSVIQITSKNVGTGRDLSNLKNIPNSGTGRDLSLQEQKIKSLSEIIGAFKTTTSKKVHEFGLVEFKWQRSFHDHIIRNLESYNTIIHYIKTNPKNWDKDVFNN
jgi:putative transposase